jgi:WD40 repeat protein
VVQAYQPHASEIRSVRFSVHSYYLLTASYDKKVVMTSLNGKKIMQKKIINLILPFSHLGDLTKPLVLTSVAAHTDKIIQARW